MVGPRAGAASGLASGPRIAGKSGNGFAVSWLSLSVALAVLIAVIGAKRARRARDERRERDASPCRHYGRRATEGSEGTARPARRDLNVRRARPMEDRDQRTGEDRNDGVALAKQAVGAGGKRGP